MKPWPPGLRDACLERDGGCVARGLLGVRCGGPLEAHHLWRRGSGGPDTLANLKTLCRNHHVRVHSVGREAYDLDLLRRSGDLGPVSDRVG